MRCLFMGGVADGQTLDTDGGLTWVVPHPPRARLLAYPVGVDVTMLRHRSSAPTRDRYERRTWHTPGRGEGYRYVYVASD